MGDDRPKVEMNDAAKTVASFLGSYFTWTDGYSDSASDTWDGIVKRYQDTAKLKSAVNAIEGSLRASANLDEMKALGLTGNKSDYLEMLARMKSSL